jgi:hypothetical protein
VTNHEIISKLLAWSSRYEAQGRHQHALALSRVAAEMMLHPSRYNEPEIAEAVTEAERHVNEAFQGLVREIFGGRK